MQFHKRTLPVGYVRSIHTGIHEVGSVFLPPPKGKTRYIFVHSTFFNIVSYLFLRRNRGGHV